MLLTICLVVMVILLFLRNFWATLIPSVTVPLALAGSFAAMYMMNFSIDNLSLMALTIAVGFVVDDAIVVVENIYRHVEHGEPPFTAALKGSREIGFTVLSISCSLIAVFIPLLLMSGIIGRLFREFALTVTASIAVSALVSLTLAPMMCSRFMQPRIRRRTAGSIASIERGFNAMADFYRRTLDIVLRHQPITLGVFFATMALTVVMAIEIPKGFFPIQDTGMIQGFAEAAQQTSPDEMMRLMHKIGDVILSDPDVRRLRLVHRLDRRGNSANTGRYFIVLKPHDERKLNASQIIDRLRPQLAKIEGANLFLQADAGHQCRRAHRPRQLPIHVAGHEYRRIERVVAEASGQAAHGAATRRRHQRPAGQCAEAADHHQSRSGLALRHFAAGHRRHAQRRLRPARRSPSISPS